MLSLSKSPVWSLVGELRSHMPQHCQKTNKQTVGRQNGVVIKLQGFGVQTRFKSHLRHRVSQGSPDIYREREREWLIVGLSPNRQERQVGWKFPQELMLQSWVQVCLEAEFLPPGGPQSFLLRSSTDWMRPTHIMGGSLLYSKSIDLNVNLILNGLIVSPAPKFICWNSNSSVMVLGGRPLGRIRSWWWRPHEWD